MARKTLSKTKQEKALAAVAKYLGPKMGCIEPCGKCETCKAGLTYDWQCENPTSVPAPTGEEAAYNALGPMLNPAWDWPTGGPTPTILLEGGPYDWAIEIAWDEEFRAEMKRLGIFAEPYAGYALCLYNDED